ncbi:MAG: hypothetical protein LUD12_05825 [Lachnospiraceae bacterium]|nr:hypothetical protein [Lachnospiraceae bacterium]
MFDYMEETYGSECPDEIKQALQERYRLEMKVQNLEQVIKYSAPDNFDALMSQLEQARKELCEAAARTKDLLTPWRYEQAQKEWDQLHPDKARQNTRLELPYARPRES